MASVRESLVHRGVKVVREAMSAFVAAVRAWGDRRHLMYVPMLVQTLVLRHLVVSVVSPKVFRWVPNVWKGVGVGVVVWFWFSMSSAAVWIVTVSVSCVGKLWR